MATDNLIIQPQKDGKSRRVMVAGESGIFDFNEAPRYLEGVGKGKTPLYLFLDDKGGGRFLRLEKDKQGGRWEDGNYAEQEYKEMIEDPLSVDKMWGRNTPQSEFFKRATTMNLPFGYMKNKLKEIGINTHRQISGD